MNNPAAFPIIETAPRGSQSIETGMTLRDYFAAHAMRLCVQQWAGKGTQVTPDFTAEWAYELADAMLAERERGGKE